MKKLKKLLSIVLVLTMVLSLAVSGSAASGGTFSITINNETEGYTYAAYEIFSGSLSDGVLSNIDWGDGFDGDGLVAALKADTTTVTASTGSTTMATLFASCTDAASVAAVLSAEYAYSDVAERFAELASSYVGTASATTSTCTSGKYVLSGLTAGYYLVMNTAVPDGGAYTSYILSVTKDTPIENKASVPELTKQVVEVDDTTATTSEWQDVADYDVNDTVAFRLTGTVASNIADYSKYGTDYAYTFHDVMSAGLTFDSSSVEVYIYSDGQYSIDDNYVTITSKTAGSLVDPSCYTVSTSTSDGCSFEVSFEDLLDATSGGSAITIDKNSLVVVYYNCTLNDSAVVGNSGNPNTARLEFANDVYTDSTETTPWDTVVVFTYEVDVNKVDSSGAALSGAKFTLYKKVTYTTGDTGTFYSYDADTDTFTEVVTPTDSEQYYIIVGSYDTEATNTNEFSWTGLDAGSYVLKETTVPSGYNTMADIEFTITANYTSAISTSTYLGVTPVAGDELSTISDYLSNVVSSYADLAEATAGDGTLTGNIQNSKGSELPSTGGIGTTIFYVVGGILILGAVVLLITKKRMNSEER